MDMYRSKHLIFSVLKYEKNRVTSTRGCLRQCSLSRAVLNAGGHNNTVLQIFSSAFFAIDIIIG